MPVLKLFEFSSKDIDWDVVVSGVVFAKSMVKAWGIYNEIFKDEFNGSNAAHYSPANWTCTEVNKLENYSFWHYRNG